MSGLTKPTIEGLTEKLLLDNYIKPDEAHSVQNMLQTATKGMSTEEISKLIRTLNDRVDAPSSELLTQDGLNLSVFESAINETTKVIIREKNIREQAKTKTEDPLEKVLQKELEEREHQLQIEESKDFLENSLSKFEGFDLTLSKKEVDKFANIMNSTALKEIKKIIDECKEKGIDPTERINTYIKEKRIPYFKEDIDAALGLFLAQKVDKLKEQGKTDKEIEEILIKDESGVVAAVYGSEENFRKKGTSAIGRILNNLVQRTREKDISYQTTVLKKAVLGEKNLTYDELKNKVTYLEKVKIDYYKDIKKTLEKNNDQELTDEDSKKRDELFHEIANEYLATAKSFSNLYKYTKDNPLIQDMSFEEFFDRIIMDLQKNSGGSKGEKDAINSIILVERENRVMYVLAEQLSFARGNLQAETGDMSQRIEEYDINFKRDSKKFREEYRNIRNARKAFLSQKRGLDQKNYVQKFRPEKKLSDESQESINATNTIIRDRQEILKLAKESNISKEEAAKKYFAENEDARKHYSKKEQKFLFDDKNKVIRNKFIARLRTVIINRNERDIEKTKKALEAARETIEQESDEIYNSERLADALKAESDLKNKLKKLENRKKRNTKLRDGKNAFHIVDEKSRKKLQKDIMEMFTNGKSAAEIFKTLEENGNEQDFSFDDVLNTIVSGNKKFLTVAEVKQLKENEQKIYDISIQKYASEIKLKNVTDVLDDMEKFKRQGKVLVDTALKSWEIKYSGDVEKFNKEIEKEKPKTDKLREKVKKRKEIVYRITSNEKKTAPKKTEQPIEVEEMVAPPKLTYDSIAVVKRKRCNNFKYERIC